MATDSPDYTKKITLDVSGVLTGLEELARRLGAAPDGKLGGFLVWQDHFDVAATGWTVDTSGDDSAVALDTEYSFEGASSVKLTAGGTAGNYASLSRPFAHAGPVTLAISAMLSWGADCDRIEIRLTDHQADVTKYALIRYYGKDKLLTYRDGDLGEQVIASDLDYLNDVTVFYPVRLDVDLETRTYRKLWFADKEYDLTGKPFYIGDSPLEAYSVIEYKITTTAATLWSVYLDNVAVSRQIISSGGTAPEMGSPP